MISQHKEKNNAINAFIYFWRYIRNPSRATDNFLSEKKIIWIGSFFLLYFGIGYTIVATMAYFFGALPDSTFISILPIEKWYLIQAFTTIPLVFIAHSIYSTVCYLLCRLMGGQGSFDVIFI